MSLTKLLQNSQQTLDQTLLATEIKTKVRSSGRISSISQGVAWIEGLQDCASEELLLFANGEHGLAIDLDEHRVGAVLLSDSAELAAGSEVTGSGRALEVPVGEQLLGRVCNALGKALDDGPAIDCEHSYPIECVAPSIIERQAVNKPLHTGIKVVDALVPIGRGQRELILGDRQTGKTSLAIDTIINQRCSDTICIYCAIGQRSSAVAQCINTLKAHNAMDNTIVVVGSGSEPPGLRFVSPYAATAMAEFFMHQGRDVLIVYDDLTKHARAYRELSLLLRRPPGREAYPGDIFYVHSRLLERATHLSDDLGGGSLTALPIAETQGQDISAYIPTNLISITDGQIVLSPKLFNKNQRPAVDLGKSVSRVGGASQLEAYRHLSGDLRLSYSQFEELEEFSRFATRLDDETKAKIKHGQNIRAILRQQEHQVQSVSQQIIILNTVVRKLLEDYEPEVLGRIEALLHANNDPLLLEMRQKIESGESLNSHDWQQLTEYCSGVLRTSGLKESAHAVT